MLFPCLVNFGPRRVESRDTEPPHAKLLQTNGGDCIKHIPCSGELPFPAPSAIAFPVVRYLISKRGRLGTDDINGLMRRWFTAAVVQILTCKFRGANSYFLHPKMWYVWYILKIFLLQKTYVVQTGLQCKGNIVKGLSVQIDKGFRQLYLEKHYVAKIVWNWKCLNLDCSVVVV